MTCKLFSGRSAVCVGVCAPVCARIFNLLSSSGSYAMMQLNDAELKKNYQFIITYQIVTVWCTVAYNDHDASTTFMFMIMIHTVCESKLSMPLGWMI